MKDVNLNNISNIEEKQMCDIFDSLRKNQSLTRLSVVNCDVSKVDARLNNGQLSVDLDIEIFAKCSEFSTLACTGCDMWWRSV